jgi:F0F1-type ATP synthase assembly protein I
MTAEQQKKPWGTEFAPYLTLGIQLAIAVVVFFFLGRWLDDMFGTSPWLMIAGLVVGTAGGFIQFFRTVVVLGRKQDAESKTASGKREQSDEN